MKAIIMCWVLPKRGGLPKNGLFKFYYINFIIFDKKTEKSIYARQNHMLKRCPKMQMCLFCPKVTMEHLKLNALTTKRLKIFIFFKLM